MLDEERNDLKDKIRIRTENHVGDWTPFVRNVEDLLNHIDELSNEIGEVKGMVKNLRKILIKLEVIDDRFIF